MNSRPAVVSVLLWSLCGGGALAADRSVLVPPVEARTRAASTAATALTGLIEAEIQRRGLPVANVDRLPKVGDLSARAYADSCPPRQSVGCAFVLGGAGEVGFAVAVSVATVGEGLRADVHVLNVARAEDALAFEATFAPGDEAVFAESVGEVVLAVVQGRAGVGGDIRQKEDPTIAQEEQRQKAVAGKQLDSLSKEIGGADDVGDFTRGTITREKVTAEQLAQDSVGEGVKPWERLDMTMGEYLRYRNSGLSLGAWRKRMMGRAGQVLVRPGLGYGRGPQSFEYNYQRHLDDTFVVKESWAFQTTTPGQGVSWNLALGYGLTPSLEVGVSAGQAFGKFNTLIHETTDQTPTARELPPPDPSASGSWVLGGKVLYAPLPALRARPVVGGGVAVYRGTILSDFYEIEAFRASYRPTVFNRPRVVAIEGLVGGELRLSDRLDAFAHVPLGLVLGGTLDQFQASGEPGNIARVARPDPAVFSAGLLAGVQIRLGGRAPDRGDDPDFEPRD